MASSETGEDDQYGNANVTDKAHISGFAKVS